MSNVDKFVKMFVHGILDWDETKNCLLLEGLTEAEVVAKIGTKQEYLDALPK